MTLLNMEFFMKTYNCLSAFLLVFTLTVTASAQNYPVLKSERIYAPWDIDTTANNNQTYISLTQEGGVVIVTFPSRVAIPSFNFYDEYQKTWSKKQIDDTLMAIDHFYNDYTFDFKTMVGYGDRKLPEYKEGIKWILDYGNSVLIDTIEGMYSNVFGVKSVTPSLSYVQETDFAQERTYNNFIYKPSNSTLYRRTNNGGVIKTKMLLDLRGGSTSVPEYQQHYRNQMLVAPIDSETVIVGVDRYYVNLESQGGAVYERYTLLINSSGMNLISDTILLPKKNNDGQYFLKRRPGSTTYLYSSARHGITSANPINFGFIDTHINQVKVISEYANGTKGYYCICKSEADYTDPNTLLLYSIDSLGVLKKYYISGKMFDYPISSITDSNINYSQIEYADDTIMYLGIRTRKIDENDVFYSKEQLYKIYLKEQINSVAEQPAVFPLRLYPNPTDHTLRWNTATGTAVITDALGRTLLEVPASAMEADVSVLATGMYFLTIRDGVGSSTRSFVVLR